MRASAVFTPNGEPGVTYVGDHLMEKARQLRQNLEAGAGVISLSGPSKSGKTVFIEKNIGRERLVSVTGAGVTSAEMLWNRVFAVIGTPVKVSATASTTISGNVSAKGAAGVPLVAHGEVSAGASVGHSSGKSEESAVDHLRLLISELGGTDFVVFIDDFHYIPRDVQVTVSNQIKEAIHGGVTFVCASVPYHSDDMLLANADLRGRSFKFDFDYWDLGELKKIGQRGFEALRIEPANAMLEAFAREAAGSPQLMQALCLNCCFETGHEEQAATPTKLAADMEVIRRVCRRTSASGDYSSTVAKMQEGPKTRGTERKSHVLKGSNAVVDVYPLILTAISKDPPELTIRYANLTDRIAKLCAGEPPSGSSVTGACSHMSEIANDAENRMVVEWDGENDTLDIRDPYLLFFLRWGEWN